MIRLLRGHVTARGKDFLVVEMGSSIGLKVFATEPTIAQFNTGAPITLHTYLVVREDALTLFGFTDEEELAMFELLLTVSGVGPKAALAILSTLSPNTLRLALANDEPALIARAPGVGKRTAQKVVLELKDKVHGPIAGLEALLLSTDADSEVIDALTALGYSVVEAQRAVQKLPKELVGVEERLRYALSQFGG